MGSFNIVIEAASPDDIPKLAAINASAYYPDPFFHTAWPDEATMVPFYTKRLAARFATPDTTVWMAKDEHGRVIGFVALTLVDAKPVEDSQAPSVSQQALGAGTPVGLDMNMVQDVQAAVGLMMRRITEKHYSVLSAFAVSPSAQRRGVGTALLQRCISMSDSKRIPIWLVSLPGSYPLCVKYGFEVRDSTDMDLSKYARWDANEEKVYWQRAMKRHAGNPL